MRIFILCVGVFLLSVAPIEAQPPSSYLLKISNQGATAPFSTSTLLASGFVCNQTPKLIVSGSQLNPTKVAFDDPANPTGADCVFVDSGAGPLLALPFSTQAYTATLAIVNTAGTSPDSVASNSFSRPGLVATAPAGVRVGR